MNNEIDMKRAKRLYSSQKSNAKRRGIDWKFTFESWVAFWGGDLAKRGPGHDRLCMQRFGDSGPYHPDNVRKGYAMQNAKTAGVIRRHKNLSESRRFKQTDEDFDVIRKTFYPEAQ